jgi:hypothetical protein
MRRSKSWSVNTGSTAILSPNIILLAKKRKIGATGATLGVNTVEARGLFVATRAKTELLW